MKKLEVEKYSESNDVLSFYEEYVSTYRTRYVAEIQNTYLNKEKTLKAYELYDLEYKVKMQFLDWCITERELRVKENIALSVEQRNQAYQKNLEDIDNILLYTLSVNDAVDWESLKATDDFTKPEPLPLAIDKLNNWDLKNKPTLLEVREEPWQVDYKPQLSIIDKLYPPLKKKKIEECNYKFKKAYEEWLIHKECIKSKNDDLLKIYEEKKEKKKKYYQTKDEEAIKEWEREKVNFYTSQQLHNASVDVFKEKYNNHDKEAVEEYCELVLNNSKYPDFISKNFELEYNAKSKLLIVEYQLPNISQFPTEKECKYVVSKAEYKVTYISLAELNKRYDKALYDITLRTIHELFEADVNDIIQVISFNGWVNCIDKATGNPENNCIISVQVEKNDFLKINLKNVDSKVCFKSLKGISSSKLFSITPIKPIMQITKNDKRFIASHSVVNDIDNSTNLAIMDWEDFEHLIREVFEKEFSGNGGEVKITQASRDGGVDAVVFDPDPIRGGKIVIQAKRYTNTVGVSAVRDLYGTVMNEGATKGLLVTTADFGPDAYTFVKDKPLTLINGANLLYLLEKHGIHARINIKEAKMLK